jgi:hypothetical protein
MPTPTPEAERRRSSISPSTSPTRLPSHHSPTR